MLPRPDALIRQSYSLLIAGMNTSPKSPGINLCNRHTAKGGKRAPKWAALTLAGAFEVLLVIFGLLGSSVDSLAYLTGTFFVVGFAGYEAWRLYVRRANPLPAWKR